MIGGAFRSAMVARVDTFVKPHLHQYGSHKHSAMFTDQLEAYLYQGILEVSAKPCVDKMNVGRPPPPCGEAAPGATLARSVRDAKAAPHVLGPLQLIEHRHNACSCNPLRWAVLVNETYMVGVVIPHRGDDRPRVRCAS